MCIGSFFETRGLAPLSSTDADGVASFRGFPAKRGSRSPSVADDYLSSGADATTRMSRKSTKRLRGDDAEAGGGVPPKGGDVVLSFSQPSVLLVPQAFPYGMIERVRFSYCDLQATQIGKAIVCVS